MIVHGTARATEAFTDEAGARDITTQDLIADAGFHLTGHGLHGG